MLFGIPKIIYDKFCCKFPLKMSVWIHGTFVCVCVFFFSAWIITSHGFTVHETKCTVYRSHDTIHTFKNYFVIVFSVFSFSKNKLYPNEPLMYKIKECWQIFDFLLWSLILSIFIIEKKSNSNTQNTLNFIVF